MISEKKKVITSLTVTNYGSRDQIDLIKVALSRKHCTVHLFCNCKKGQIWPAGRTLGTTVFKDGEMVGTAQLTLYSQDLGKPNWQRHKCPRHAQLNEV